MLSMKSGFRISYFLVFFFVSASLAHADSRKEEGGREATFGRGGFDLGWGKGNDDDDDDEAKPKATPTPTPTPKRDDSFFKQNVEDTGAGDKL